MAKAFDKPTLTRIPTIKLERESSLPRIEVDRPMTPTTQRHFQNFTLRSTGGITNANYASAKEKETFTDPIPPNTKKLRMKSFLWVKPVQTTNVTSTLFAQLKPVLLANIGALSTGLALGYSAILLPQLRPDSEPLEDLGHHVYNFTSTRYRPFTADTEQGSWIASIFGVGAIFGGLTSAFLGNKYGRRVCLLLLCMLDLLAWTMMGAAQDLAMMLAGRFIAGFVSAGYSPCIQIYVAEITQAKNRGWMLGLTVPIMSIGTLVMYIIGSYVPWHLAAASCTPVPIILGLCLCYMYESPYWYFQKGKDKLAYTALEKFRGKDENVVCESFQIQEHLKEVVNEDISLFEGVQRIFYDVKYYRPFITLNALFLFMAFSGKMTIEFYAVEIFTKAGGKMDKYLSAVIVAVIQLVGSMLLMLLVGKFSRKILIVLSAFIMGTALIVLGWDMYSMAKDGVGVEWLPLVCVVVYMVAAPLGLGTIPYMYIAEFFPSELRSVLGGLTIALSNLEMFIVVKTFPNLENLIGDHGAFWIYAGTCFMAIFFALSYIPETKDKSLIQVSSKFDRMRKTRRASPWITPIPSPSASSFRKLQFQTAMFTQ